MKKIDKKNAKKKQKKKKKTESNALQACTTLKYVSEYMPSAINPNTQS